MILVVCRSEGLFSALKEFAKGMDLARFEGEVHETLASRIASDKPAAVVYEPFFFVDPAPYRLGSPSTRFVVVGSPGDEDRTEEALSLGAVSVLHKPLIAREVLSALSLAL